MVTYEGPDTGSQQKPLPSHDLQMNFYTSKNDLTSIPEISALKPHGMKAHIPLIDFQDLDKFKQYFPDVPEKNFAVQLWGKFKISMPGSYTFCTSSSDGSILWIDQDKVVDNSGVHNEKESCKALVMAEGIHEVPQACGRRGGASVTM